MKIFIMTDLEGVAGVTNARDHIFPESKYYEHACELLTLEASAAAQGAFEAGADEVLVADGHGEGAVKRQLLHPRARLLTGRPRPPGQPWGCDESFAATMMVGQHAMANTDGGHLCHTGSFDVESCILDGDPIGELGRWAIEAGIVGVPLILVSGDSAACDEAIHLVPSIEVAVVKWGLARGSASGLTGEENSVFNSVATHLHPDEARTLIREAAYRAVMHLHEIPPVRSEPPHTLTVAIRPDKPGEKPRQAIIEADDFMELMKLRSEISGALRAGRVPKPKRRKAKRSTTSRPKKKAAKPARSKAKAKPGRKKKR